MNYGSSGTIDDALNRVRSIKEDASILARYSYLGSGRPVMLHYADPNVQFTYFAPGQTGDAGDPYTGLDRFGRIADQRWRSTTAFNDLERIEYGYDRLSNRKWSRNAVAPGGQDELYAYDGLNQLKELERGTLNAGKTGIVGTPSREENWNYDPSGNWHGSGTAYLVKQSGSTVLNQNRTHNQANEITGITRYRQGSG